MAGGRGGQGEEDQAAANCDAGAGHKDIVWFLRLFDSYSETITILVNFITQYKILQVD